MNKLDAKLSENYENFLVFLIEHRILVPIDEVNERY